MPTFSAPRLCPLKKRNTTQSFCRPYRYEMYLCGQEANGSTIL